MGPLAVSSLLHKSIGRKTIHAKDRQVNASYDFLRGTWAGPGLQVPKIKKREWLKENLETKRGARRSNLATISATKRREK